MLSDYNMLRNDDKRIKEVTDLGLKYNLLTKYTSFIAVDNKVRNKNGSSTTVKQPLPLPEGVSDYAVGLSGQIAAQSPVPATAEHGGTMLRKSNIAAKSEASPLEESRKDKETKGDTRSFDNKIQINEILVPDKISKQEVGKIIQDHLSELKACFKKTEANGKVKIEIVISIDGSVKTANIVSGKIKDKEIKKCILNAIKSWKFTGLNLKKETTITFILVT